MFLDLFVRRQEWFAEWCSYSHRTSCEETLRVIYTAVCVQLIRETLFINTATVLTESPKSNMELLIRSALNSTLQKTNGNCKEIWKRKRKQNESRYGTYKVSAVHLYCLQSEI